MGKIMIFPMMMLLGIDKKGDDKSERSWAGVKKFFEKKMNELNELQAKLKDNSESGKDKLMAVVLEEVIDAVNNQLSKTYYFTRQDAGTKYGVCTSNELRLRIRVRET